MLTTTSHDSVFLRADNSLIDMNYITSFTDMTDKWFYKLISEGHFPKPIKLGAAAAGIKAKCHSRYSNESKNHGGQKYETCCDTGTLAMFNVSALVLWRCSLVLVPRESSCVPSGQPALCHPD